MVTDQMPAVGGTPWSRARPVLQLRLGWTGQSMSEMAVACAKHGGARGRERVPASPVVVPAQQQVCLVWPSRRGRHNHENRRLGRAAATPIGADDDLQVDFGCARHARLVRCGVRWLRCADLTGVACVHESRCHVMSSGRASSVQQGPSAVDNGDQRPASRVSTWRPNRQPALGGSVPLG